MSRSRINIRKEEIIRRKNRKKNACENRHINQSDPSKLVAGFYGTPFALLRPYAWVFPSLVSDPIFGARVPIVLVSLSSHERTCRQQNAVWSLFHASIVVFRDSNYIYYFDGFEENGPDEYSSKYDFPVHLPPNHIRKKIGIKWWYCFKRQK